MNGRRLQDRLHLSLGASARRIGQPTDAVRPTGPFHPLDANNRFLRLPACFISATGKFNRTNDYGSALWHGIFDAAYTRPGDYLIAGCGTFFVASQLPLLPILCVKANRIISIAQPSMQTSVANNAYGGYTPGGSIVLMDGWPANVHGETRSSHSNTNLPTDQVTPYWTVLVPSSAGVMVSPGDIITDDLGRTAVIAATDLTDLGWRISARMATT